MIHFEWDAATARENFRKHGISFGDAVHVFDDPCALCLFDREVGGELRWHTIGLVGGIALILVVHTLRDRGSDEVIRIISARKATGMEVRRYVENC